MHKFWNCFPQFEDYKSPSLEYIRFAEHYLSGGKSDPSHNPSFKSCMIRIPGTHNSKYPQGKNEVKIIQEWDGFRPPMNLLLDVFHDHLLHQKLKEIKLKKRIETRFGIPGDRTHSILWIETFLQTPVSDYRKNAVGLIFAPYLTNIRKLSYDKASLIIREWLKNCSELRPLDPDFEYKLKILSKHVDQKITTANKIQYPREEKQGVV